MIKSKEEVIEQLVVFSVANNIPMDQISLGGGGALLMMGLREQTEDLNVWIDDPHFLRYAEHHNVVVRAWHDPVVPPDEGVVVWARKRNRYFETVEVDGVHIQTPLTLIVHKRGSLMEPKRPLVKRQQDRLDIAQLNDILKEKNKVREYS